MTDKQQAAQAGRDTEHLSFSADASNTVLAHLCGPLDENLRQMETIVGARIARRGNLFHVSGERRAAQRAVRALEVLLDRVKREGEQHARDCGHA